MCLNPVKLPQPDGTVRIVPCGRCLQCVRAYQQTWVARLSEELKSWKSVNGKKPVIFFTLTYSPEHIPQNFLQVTTTGVYLTKQPLFSTSLPVTWNCTLKEPARVAKERQSELSKEFRLDVQCFIDTFGPVENEELDQFTDDLPSWAFDPESINGFGLPISRCLAFNTVRYSDVRAWLKSCRVMYGRLVSPETRSYKGEDYKCNPRYISEIDGKKIPDAAITTSFKYFICSEYGPTTLRPHYHGCLFGVTEEEFRKVFLPAWENRFGHVDFDVFDPLKGGMMYISKYCSKGSYDNPYSKRDFFYPDGKEYHSKHYEGSIADFGVDLPICDSVFRLMSHGLGIAYAFRKSVQDYWKVRIDDDFVTRSVDINVPPSIDFHRLLSLSKTLAVSYRFEDRQDLFRIGVLKDSSTSPLYEDPNIEFDSVVIRKYSASGRLIAESLLDFNLESNLEIEDLYASKQYSRQFAYHPKDKDGKYLPQVVSKTAFSPLPRYYHRWLLPPSSKLKISASALRRRAAIDEDRARFIRQFRTSDEKAAALRELDFADTMVREETTKRLRESASRFYSKFDPEDLKDKCGL